ncbi:conserved hypothetical protein (plasmid) [Borreliella valaisiana VS116]|uniref:Uncharacterized protein n=1 Tax=Borreliella valaisiana VS116 TaxID=445987 RepID=C0R8C6_BORVA|nr:conserved hypothetical protein [Borreliella valaisiana VS116]
MSNIEKNQQENVNNKINGESKMHVEQRSFIGCEVFKKNLFQLKKKVN